MSSEQERIAFLEQKLALQAEENFELQAALAVAEAECQHKIQNVERTSKQTERNLRDQLRRSQHEANLARTQNKHQHQPRVPLTTIVAAPVIPNPPIQKVLIPKDTPKVACGIALARHLLLVDQLTPLAPTLLRVVACNRPVSAVDVVSDCIDDFLCGSSTHKSAAYLECIHHALQLSPQACRVMANDTDDNSTETPRTCRIRIRGEHVHLHRTYQELQNPLWSPALSMESTHRGKRKRNNGEFLKVVREQCILQTRDLELSIAGMKVVCLFLPHVPEDVWPLLAGRELLTLFRQAAIRLMGKGNNSNTTIRLLHPDSTEGNDKKKKNGNSERDRSPFPKTHKTRDIEQWLSVCLATLVEFWNGSRKDASHYRVWTQTEPPGPTIREVMVTVLDLMDRVILQDSALYTSDLALSCVSWLQAMQQTNSVHWLLSQMPTSQSTPETWHRACSGVGVMVKFSHAVVIHQEIDTERGANPNDWNVIRDQSIRFIQGILRMIQCQRRDWERQPVQQQKKPPSFSSLVTFEYPELYTSIATALLFVDAKATGQIVSSDVQSMLQQQLEEIKMDQQERDDQSYVSVMKQ